MHGAQRNASLRRDLAHFLEKVRDGGVGCRGHADAPTGIDQGRNHVRAGERLARAGWSLDRQTRLLETEPDSTGDVDDVVPGKRNCPTRHAAVKAGRESEQKITRRAVGAGCVDPVVGDPARDLLDRVLEHRVVVELVGDQRLGVRHVCEARAALDVDVVIADLDYVASAVLGGRVMGTVTDRELVLLRLESVAVDRRLLEGTDLAIERQPADALGVVEEVCVVVGVHAMEVHPPLGLVLTAVPLEQLREKPSSLLFVSAFVRVVGDAGGQTLGQRREPSFALGQRLGGST